MQNISEVIIKRGGLFILIILLLSAATAPAADWYALSNLNDAGLIEKIYRLQEKLDQDPSDYETIKAMGITYHFMAVKDAEKYAPRAVDTLSRAHRMNKEDNETLCYLGSAFTMLSQTTWNPIKKMKYVNKGTGFMDKAVKRDPDNISVRMTRAKNSKSLPSFLNRGEIALEDFEYLAGLIDKNPDSYISLKKEVYASLSELYDKAGEKSKAKRFRELAE